MAFRLTFGQYCTPFLSSFPITIDTFFGFGYRLPLGKPWAAALAAGFYLGGTFLCLKHHSLPVYDAGGYGPGIGASFSYSLASNWGIGASCQSRIQSIHSGRRIPYGVYKRSSRFWRCWYFYWEIVQIESPGVERVRIVESSLECNVPRNSSRRAFCTEERDWLMRSRGMMSRNMRQRSRTSSSSLPTMPGCSRLPAHVDLFQCGRRSCCMCGFAAKSVCRADGDTDLLLLSIPVLALLPPAFLSHLDAPCSVPTDLRHAASSNIVSCILHQDAPARHHPPAPRNP